MSRKQWQFWIPAGVLSLAILAGTAGAEEKGVKPESSGLHVPAASTTTTKKKSTERHKGRKKKDAAPSQTPA